MCVYYRVIRTCYTVIVQTRVRLVTVFRCMCVRNEFVRMRQKTLSPRPAAATVITRSHTHLTIEIDFFKNLTLHT